MAEVNSIEDVTEKTVYVFTTNYPAVNRNRNSSETKTFLQNTEVVGVPYTPVAAANVRVAPSVLVEDKFIIPLSVLSEKEKIVVIPAAGNVSAAVKNVKNNSGFRNGALIGTAVGVAFAMWKNKNVFLYAITGLAAGGAVGYVIMSSKPKASMIPKFNADKSVNV